MDFPEGVEYRLPPRFQCATTHTHTHTAILALVLFAAGCNNGKVTQHLGKDEPVSACEEQCDLGLSPFPLNLVVLTSNSAAPVVPTTPIATCAPADTSWPCLHPNSLNVRFLELTGPATPGVPICGNPSDPNTCVSFLYGKHATYSQLGSPTDAHCIDLLDRSDPATSYWTNTGDSYYGTDAVLFYGDITDALKACPDKTIYDPAMINEYLFENPFTNYHSFNDPYADCLPNNFIDVARLPTSGDPLNFSDAASEHEMGHGFGLDHTCIENIPNSLSDPSGIMQTTADNCCCEAAEAHVHEGEHEWDYGSGDYFTTICSNCSADFGTIEPTCDDSPGEYDDPVCGSSSHASHGNRTLGFSDSYDAKWAVGDWADDHRGQVTKILDTAYDMCVCRCDLESAEENSRVAVANELACHGGTGRFALVPIDWTDQNDDELGFSNLVPVLVSGGHLGRLSWITSATLVSPGSASRLVMPSVTQGWAFSTSDPDLLTGTGFTVVDNAHPSFTFSPGVVGGAFLWGADGIAPFSEGFEPPQVDLQWVCAAEIRSGDVLWVHRPPGPYALHAQLIGGTWAQDLLIRPDYDNELLWIELRGYSRFSETVAMSENEDGSWSFSVDRGGFTLSGWLKPSGTPAGATLQFHVTTAAYGGWSVSSLNLPPLPRLP